MDKELAERITNVDTMGVGVIGSSVLSVFWVVCRQADSRNRQAKKPEKRIRR